MKVIVTGATGTAGKEIVKQCLSDARITKIVILTRRAVPMDIECNPKAEVVMHQDFTRYSDELLRRLEGASACIWAIGASMEKCNNDKDLHHLVTVEYPTIAAAVMCERLADKTPGGAKFNFVLCSTQNPVRHAPRPLLFLGDPRRHRPEADKRLFDLADSHPRRAFAVWILRPGALLGPDAPAPQRRHRLTLSSSTKAGIEGSQFGRAAVRVACEGWKDRIIDNDALLKM